MLDPLLFSKGRLGALLKATCSRNSNIVMDMAADPEV